MLEDFLFSDEPQQELNGVVKVGTSRWCFK